MEEFGFSYTLQSNASLNYYPDNNASRFRVQLPARMDKFDNNWVVGLSEIHFPLSFTGVSNVKNNVVNHDKNDGPSYLVDNLIPGTSGKRKRTADPAMYEPYMPGDFIPSH